MGALTAIRTFALPVLGSMLALGGLTFTPDSALAELLFEDDFASGDFSKHNAYFRWGRSGSIPLPGNDGGGLLQSVKGPAGSPVNAIRLTYGTWQEMRFHLTKSVSEVRTESGASNTVYPVVWMSYWLYVPANYAHGPTNPSNNKGFVTLWKDEYLSNYAQFAWDWVRTGTSNSQLRCWVLDRNSGYNWVTGEEPFTTVEQSHQLPGNPRAAYAFRPVKDVGRWQHIAFGYKMADSPTVKNGYIKIYRDGVLIAERVNMDSYMAPPLHGVDRGYLFGYHNSGYSETTTFYITGFKFGTSEADVRMTPAVVPEPPTGVIAE